MKQGSAEWFQERCGKATASRFADILSKVKSGESAGRRNYRAQLVAERLTGVPAETYTNAIMQRGTDLEPEARAAYEDRTGLIVVEIAFVEHSELAAGASPDGLVDDDGGVEIKCPNTATHIDYLLNGMGTDYTPQIQGAMWLTGRKYWDFVSYDDRMPERHRLYTQRVMRDEAFIGNLEVEVRKFLIEVDETIRKLENL